ncbi:MAG: hypothetical protein KC800_02355 [Candidatus Eremiobacteraeota bacterium]|nr:hypothetical protein [Candidatus Eremiobacteraeota bacterium]
MRINEPRITIRKDLKTTPVSPRTKAEPDATAGAVRADGVTLSSTPVQAIADGVKSSQVEKVSTAPGKEQRPIPSGASTALQGVEQNGYAVTTGFGGHTLLMGMEPPAPAEQLDLMKLQSLCQRATSGGAISSEELSGVPEDFRASILEARTRTMLHHTERILNQSNEMMRASARF